MSTKRSKKSIKKSKKLNLIKNLIEKTDVFCLFQSFFRSLLNFSIKSGSDLTKFVTTIKKIQVRISLGFSIEIWDECKSFWNPKPSRINCLSLVLRGACCNNLLFLVQRNFCFGLQMTHCNPWLHHRLITKLGQIIQWKIIIQKI